MFAAAFDLLEGGQRTRGGLLKPETVRQMFSSHSDIRSQDDNTKITAHYGYGWTLKEEPDSAGQIVTVARHGGALPCTAASVLHFPDGTNLAVLFNLGQSADGRFLGRNIEGPLTTLVREARNWPTSFP